jgi:hypothetical protein
MNDNTNNSAGISISLRRIHIVIMYRRATKTFVQIIFKFLFFSDSLNLCHFVFGFLLNHKKLLINPPREKLEAFCCKIGNLCDYFIDFLKD